MKRLAVMMLAGMVTFGAFVACGSSDNPACAVPSSPSPKPPTPRPPNPKPPAPKTPTAKQPSPKASAPKPPATNSVSGSKTQPRSATKVDVPKSVAKQYQGLPKPAQPTASTPIPPEDVQRNRVPRPPQGTNLGDPYNALNPYNAWNPISPYYSWWFWSLASSSHGGGTCVVVVNNEPTTTTRGG